LDNNTAGGITDRLRAWFPEREFFMRSHGQVRFIKISSRLQMSLAGGALALVAGWGLTMGAMAITQYQASSERAALLDREAKVAQSEERVDAYRADLGEVTQDLKRRQDFIEAMLPMLPDDVRADETVSDSSSEAAAMVDKVSASIPEAAELARVEARQLALVENLTRYADRRAASAEKAIRKLGLDPDSMLRGARRAMGGPLEKLGAGENGEIDPRFERMGLSLARMSALEDGLQKIPQYMPADIRSISSGFGYRRDPFTGGGAMHSGLDFAAPHGAPIHAAAEGKVTFVGRKGGYGKAVEISHVNGMVTRYAHMSRFEVKRGQTVQPGDVIGAIGSTGRSTGPHLHFEVRINNRAVNPRPFLETAPDVLKEARAEFTGPRRPSTSTSTSKADPLHG
jgi:murein DD-endopeptidase MepM/ murein hydrolase activator NlpD